MNSKIVAVILIAFGIVVLAIRASLSRPRENPSMSSECTSRPPTATSFRQSSGHSRWSAASCYCL